MATKQRRYLHRRRITGEVQPQQKTGRHSKAERSEGKAQVNFQSEHRSVLRKNSKGADRGTYASICYLYDAATNKYREIVLKKTGDENYENLSEEAKTLSAWLDSLAER
jgi:hypothetical protein